MTNTPTDDGRQTPDVLDALTSLRPTSQTLSHEWNAGVQQQVLTEIFDETTQGSTGRAADLMSLPSMALSRSRVQRSRARRSRRVVIVAGVAAAAAAAAVVLPTVLPSGSPGGPASAAAAELEKLAAVAAEKDVAVGRGQYAYTFVTSEQRGGAGLYAVPAGTVSPAELAKFQREQATRTSTQTVKQWIAPSGKVWMVNSVISQDCLASFGHDVRPGVVTDGYENLSADEIATLPTSHTELAEYIDAHPSGGNRGARNRFVVVGDLLRSGLAPSQLRAAAIRVLAHTDGITVDPDAVDAAGRLALRADYAEDGYRISLYFDPMTSLIHEEATQEPGNGRDWTGVDYVAIVHESRVVDSLPTGLPLCTNAQINGNSKKPAAK